MSGELEELKAKINAFGHGAAKVGTLEYAIRVADAENDTVQGFELRQELIDEVNHTGQPEKALVAFAWCLAQFDRDPTAFSEWRLLWDYKGTIKRLREFPHITLAQIEAALSDLTVRFERYGQGLRAVRSLNCWTAAMLGRREETLEALPKWRKTPRDSMNDCVACETDDLMEVHFFLGHDRQALRIAKPILEGTLTCGSIPHCTFSTILVPLVRLGRFDEALRFHEAGYPLVRGDASYTQYHANHLVFKAMTDDLPGAVKVFEKNLPIAWDSVVPLRRFQYFRSSLFLFRRLLNSGKPTKRVQLPKTFPLWKEKGGYDLAELAHWFETEATDLARQFDARSGNDYRMSQMRELDVLEELVAR